MSDLKDRRQAEQNIEAILNNLRTELNKKPSATLKGLRNHAFIAHQLAMLVPDTSDTYGNLIGPVYSTKALEAMWGISRQAISKKVAARQLIGLKVGGNMLYPVFQFDGKRVREDVREIAQLLLGSVDPFTVAQWFMTPCHDDPNGRTYLQMLDQNELNDVRDHAIAAASRWAA